MIFRNISLCLTCKYVLFFLKEVDSSTIEKESPYLLFFEREGIPVSQYLPDLKNTNLESSSEEDEFDSEVKRNCVLQ